MNKRVLSSSASGYLIIPKLQEGNYNLNIGFPKNEWPEQNISCTINNKDVGYILKNFGNNTWGLFNLQTMEIINAIPKNIENQNLPAQNEKILSKDAGDGKDSIKTETEIKSVKINEVVQPQPESKISETVKNRITVKRILAVDNKEGSERVYVDTLDNKWDTIRIFMPVEKIEINNIPVETSKDSLKQIEENIEKSVDSIVINTNANIDTVPKSISKTVQEEKQPEIKNVKTDAIQNTIKTVMPNSDCRSMAAEDDFYKLRKKMAAETGTDGMVNAAKKIFKSKCFTTEQIKNLSLLFLSDEGKYKFYDAAYPFVSDTYNFYTLEALLIDNYFKIRFKAMLRN